MDRNVDKRRAAGSHYTNEGKQELVNEYNKSSEMQGSGAPTNAPKTGESLYEEARRLTRYLEEANRLTKGSAKSPKEVFDFADRLQKLDKRIGYDILQEPKAEEPKSQDR